MNRSRMIELLKINIPLGPIEPQELAEYLLGLIEHQGMLPPSEPSKKFKPSYYEFGAYCTMRCDCPDCNPNFPVNKWEPEHG